MQKKAIGRGIGLIHIQSQRFASANTKKLVS